ncbi:MAG: YceI family protein [Ornithinimicrobium sp.]
MDTTTQALPPGGTYEIDPARSTITFATRHMFGLGAVNGTFTVHDGTITVPSTEDASGELEVGLRVDAASFHTGTDRRDTHVKSADFLDVGAHPFIEFSASSPVDGFDGASVAGSLRVVGNEGPVQVQVREFATTGDGVRVQGSTTINRYDFGVTKMKGMAGRDLEMSIDLVANRSE